MTPNHKFSDGQVQLVIHVWKSLMAEWLGRVSQGHEMYYHDLEIVGSNPGEVALGAHITVLLSKSYLNKKCQLPVPHSIWELVHLKSLQTSKIMWQYISFKSLMANWLGWACQGHEIYYHDLEVLGLNLDQVELGVHSTLKSKFNPQNKMTSPVWAGKQQFEPWLCL